MRRVGYPMLFFYFFIPWRAVLSSPHGIHAFQRTSKTYGGSHPDGDKKFLYLHKIRGGENNDEPRNRPSRELVLGKDRELIHFAIDLKWVWTKLTDKFTYINFLKSSWRGVKNFAGMTNGGKEFRDIAIDILSFIRSLNPESTVKLFQGNIKMAEWLATHTDRLILLYIEEGNSKSPSTDSMQYRRTLSDPLLGDFINEKFVFYAGSMHHKATRSLVSSIFSDRDSPSLAVLVPRRDSEESAPQVLAIMRIPVRDIQPENFAEFLERAIEVHRSKLHDVRDNRLDAESAYSDDSSDFYGSERAHSEFADELLIRAPRVEVDSQATVAASADSLDPTLHLNLKDKARSDGATHFQDEDGNRRSLVAVTVSMRSGLQFQHHFDTSETLGTVATWGLRNNAIASDDSEEFFIAQPTVRFTPSNMKRTLSELRLPRSVVLSVVKKTQRSAAAFAAAALESANPGERSVRPDTRVYVPPGAPV